MFELSLDLPVSGKLLTNANAYARAAFQPDEHPDSNLNACCANIDP
jgi:hypothetical protein